MDHQVAFWDNLYLKSIDPLGRFGNHIWYSGYQNALVIYYHRIIEYITFVKLHAVLIKELNVFFSKRFV